MHAAYSGFAIFTFNKSNQSMILNWKRILWFYVLMHMLMVVLVNFGLGVKGFKSTPYIRAGFVVPLLMIVVVYFRVVGINNVLLNAKIIPWNIRALFQASCLWLVVGVFSFGLYLVTDYLYFFMFMGLLVVFLSSLKINNPSAYVVDRSLIYIAVFLSIFQVVFYFTLGKTIALFYVFLSTFLLAYVFSSNGNLNKWTTLLVSSSLVVGFLLLNRAFYLQVFLVFILIYFFVFDLKRKAYVFMGLVILVFIVSLLFPFIESLIEGTPLSRRVNETIAVFFDGVSDETSIPMMQRFFEMDEVVNEFRKKPWMLMFGFGFGATLDMTGSLDASVIGSQLMGAGTTHNIHFLPVALLYRYGFLGLFLYLILIAKAVVNVMRFNVNVGRLSDNGWGGSYLFVNCYLLALTFYSMTASSTFFIDPMMPFCLALFYYIESKEGVVNER